MKSDIAFVGLGYCSNDYLCRVPEIPLDHKIEALEHLTQGGGPARNEMRVRGSRRRR